MLGGVVKIRAFASVLSRILLKPPSASSFIAGVHWLNHNGGRPNNRTPGYPWKYMKLVRGGRIEDHWPVRP